MTERRLSTRQEAATHLLDTLQAGGEVTLEITARDAATGALLRLIGQIHDTATVRQVGIHMTPLGEDGLRLRLAEG